MIEQIQAIEHQPQDDTVVVYFKRTPSLTEFLDRAIQGTGHIQLHHLDTSPDLLHIQQFLSGPLSPNRENFLTAVCFLSDITGTKHIANPCIRCGADHLEEGDLCEGCALETSACSQQ